MDNAGLKHCFNPPLRICPHMIVAYAELIDRLLPFSLIFIYCHTPKLVSRQDHSHSCPKTNSKDIGCIVITDSYNHSKSQAPINRFPFTRTTLQRNTSCYVHSRQTHHDTSTLILKAAPQTFPLPEDSSRFTKTKSS